MSAMLRAATIHTAALNLFYGDAGGDMFDFAKGGNDIFRGGDASSNTFFGDAGGTMSGHSYGGDDTLIGGSLASNESGNFENRLIGDANAMSGHAQGGNDTLISGNSYGTGQVTNVMVGDALTLSGSAKGGNNTRYAGNAGFGGTVINDMWGAPRPMKLGTIVSLWRDDLISGATPAPAEGPTNRRITHLSVMYYNNLHEDIDSSIARSRRG